MKKQNKENFKYLKKSLEKNNRLLLICSSNSEIEYIHSKLIDFVNKDRIVRLYDREILPYDHFSTPDDIIKKRFNEIQNIYDAKLIISSLKNLFEFYPQRGFYKSLKKFRTNEVISIGEIKEILQSLNYKRVEKVSSLNEYSHRGGIVDINSTRYKNPIRLDFWGNKVENIRVFDKFTQLSLSEIKNTSLTPVSDINLSSQLIENLVN